MRLQAARALSERQCRQAAATFQEWLDNHDPVIREVALRGLGDLGDSASLKKIRAALNDRFAVRTAAAEVLTQLGAPGGIELLIRWAESGGERPAVGTQSAKALMSIGFGAPGGSAWGKATDLRHSNWVVRQQATIALATAHHPDARQLLNWKLQDSDYDVRESARVALGLLADEPRFEPLLALFDSGYDSVRASAAKTILELSQGPHSDRLAELLATKFGSLSTAHRIDVAFSLLQFGNREAESFLIARLEDPRLSDRRRARVAAALVAAGKAPAMWRARIAGEPVSRRLAVIKALMEYPGEEAGAFLQAMLGSDNHRVGHAAFEALRASDAEIEASHLVPLLANPGPRDEALSMPQKISVAAFLLRQEHHQGAESFLIARLEEPWLAHRLRAQAVAALMAAGKAPANWRAEFAWALAGRRLAVVEALGESPSKESHGFLMEMLGDDNYKVRLAAVARLRSGEAEIDPQRLAPLLADPNVQVQHAASQYLGDLEAAPSVAVLRASVLRAGTPISTQHVQLDALARIGTTAAAEAILEAVEQYETPLGLRGYRLLRQLGDRTVVPALAERLRQVTEQYHEWRRDRDDRRRRSDEEKAGDPPVERPNGYLTFELALTLSSLGGKNLGIELLSHPLADARGGAALGLGNLGTPALVEELQDLRARDKRPWLVHAAYRAIDHALVRIELIGGAKDLAALQNLLTGLERDHAEEDDGNNGLRERLRWTIRELGAYIGQDAAAQD